MLSGQINQDTDAALKAGQSDRLGVLRLLKTSLKNEEIKLGQSLSDDEAVRIIGAVKARAGASADGAVIARIVRERLG